MGMLNTDFNIVMKRYNLRLSVNNRDKLIEQCIIVSSEKNISYLLNDAR